MVFALGGGAPAYPEWVCQTAVSQGLIRHVFEKSPEAGDSVAIIGGGISAAHLALRHSRAGAKVHMVFRHDLREQSFDCHQDWMMTRDASERTGFIPERQLTFAGIDSFEERRDIIRRERLAAPCRPRCRGAETASGTRSRAARCDIIKRTSRGWLLLVTASRLTLTTGAEIHVDRVLLATGFSKKARRGPRREDGPEGRPGTVLLRLSGAGQVSAVGRRLRRGRARGARARSVGAEHRRGSACQSHRRGGALTASVCKLCQGRAVPLG